MSGWAATAAPRGPSPQRDGPSIRLVMTARDDLDEGVVVCPYDPLWPGKASELAGRIETHLRDLAARIEHVGSTAVAGLAAKPILDLLVGLPDQQDIDEAARRLSAIGWQDLGEAGVAGRRYMRNRGCLASNLHIVLVDREHWANGLALRDYLRDHPEDALEYAAAKHEALNAGHTRLLAYSAAKAGPVAELLSKANAWSGKRRT
jgi:GrpB-like predicted nucleotidyltransferase (UPF0157 family)